MSKRDIPLKGGDEYNAFTGWRKFIYFRPGEKKAIKRGFNQRERHTQKQKIRKDRDGGQ